MFRNFIHRIDYSCKRFAGHSKWANIRHTKGTKDAQRSALFLKLSKQIKVAAAEGGSLNPKSNLKLSQAIDQCKRFNMPTATLQSVLKSCENDKSNSKLYVLDIKGPGNCILLCEVLTNNLHHLKQTMSTPLRKNRSKFADGAVLHMFDEKGIVEAENPDLATKSKDEQLELATDHAIENNAEEVLLLDDNIFQFFCNKTHFPSLQTALEKVGYKIVNASVDYVPVKMQVIGEDDFESYEKLVAKIEEIPEVVRVFDNVSTS